MGLANSIILQKKTYPEFFKADRIIDNENGGIYVGILSDNPNLKLSEQAIRFGNSKLYRLNFFEKSNSNLTYKFESNAELKFYKSTISTIIVNYICPDQNLNVNQIWTHKKFWKNLSWNNLSIELDEIGDFIK